MEVNIDESNQVLLSIIIPHYNTPHLLKKLLRTIPDIPEIEILVIDDNSSADLDVYADCIRENSKRNVKFYSNDADNQGAGNARNVGLDHAKGKWIIFADADDFFVDDLWGSISKHVNDDSDVIYFLSTSIKADSGEASDRHVYYSELVQNYLQNPTHENEVKLRSNFWTPWAKMVRKDLIENNRIRFDSTLHSNDMMFSTKIGCLAGRISAAGSIIYCITESGNSLTAHKDKKSMRIRADVYCRYYFYLHKHLNKTDMKILGFGIRDWIYFWLYRMKIIQLRDDLLKRD